MAMGVGEGNVIPFKPRAIPLAPDAVTAARDYKFAPPFERLLSGRLCLSPNLFSRIGARIDPAALHDESARWLVQAAQEHHRVSGCAPDGGTVVIQQLARFYEAGKLSHEQRLAAVDLLGECADSEVSDESMLAQAVPVIRGVLTLEAFTRGTAGLSDPSAVQDLSRQLDEASRLGDAQEARDVLGSAETAAVAIVESRHVERLGFGIDELDRSMEGGMQRGRLGCFIGDPGSGKSMALAQMAAHAALEGQRVLVATLGEVPPAEWLLRVTANVLDVPMNSFTDNDVAPALAELERRLGRPDAIRIAEFTPEATTVGDVEQWARAEMKLGGPAQVLIVDYADQMVAGTDGEYDTGKKVFTALRALACRPDLDWWVWTASQPQRKEGNAKRKIGMQNVAGSVAKPRISDVVITLNYDEETRQMEWYVAKFRSGPGRMTIGPLPVFFECGQIAPVTRSRWTPPKQSKEVIPF